ncbi:MAG TPA: MBOAT family O-acyltransferase, partial [Polyangiaceae bacterium]|nr:MBOAT family O-acyltransferase [Polyangiaceae bacterium]
ALGHEVPERFDWPLLARNPAEFWERWNTYVASWFTRFVFVPIAKSKRRLHTSTSMRYTIATLVTFAAVGLAHEYALLLQYGRARGAPSLAFLFAAFVLVGWKAASSRLRRMLHISGDARESPVVRLSARLVFAPLFLVFACLALPALSGNAFPGAVGRALRSNAELALAQ